MRNRDVPCGWSNATGRSVRRNPGDFTDVWLFSPSPKRTPWAQLTAGTNAQKSTALMGSSVRLSALEATLFLSCSAVVRIITRTCPSCVHHSRRSLIRSLARQVVSSSATLDQSTLEATPCLVPFGHCRQLALTVPHVQLALLPGRRSRLVLTGRLLCFRPPALSDRRDPVTIRSSPVF